MGDVAEGALSRAEQVTEEVTQLAGETAVSVVDPRVGGDRRTISRLDRIAVSHTAKDTGS